MKYYESLQSDEPFHNFSTILAEKDLKRYQSMCGGALINTRYVLTAAHCISYSYFQPTWRLHSVRLGEWDTNTDPDCEVDATGYRDCAPPHQDILIEEYTIHEKYEAVSVNQWYDIGLLRLERAVAYSVFIKPICLPLDKDIRNRLYVNVSMDVAGWGLTENLTPSHIKLKVSVKGVDAKECAATYMGIQVQIKEELQICAGGESGLDSCRGDSGGPLVGNIRSKERLDSYYVLGIASYGPSSCGLASWPGVYTRVGYFVDWIIQNLKP